MSSDAEENNLEENDSERIAIKNELSSLSFEDLQKLKERIGAKLYKEVVFGKKNNPETSPKAKFFKRENKNRPREMSSKRPVRMLRDTGKVKKTEIRDPRFDPLCGEFDKKEFAENYNFLSDMLYEDIKSIRAELKQTTDPEKVLKLKRLLQSLNEQHRANRKARVQREKVEKQKKDVEKVFREGKQPYFKNKSELRVETLVNQYEELKKEGTGRIQRHLKRRQQKIKKRSNKAPVGDS
ncbi:ribosomal RNA processing protein 36 homolog isoform X1 [Papilio machaon]|uniref:ribosomal RNA processing protein 36 homolog isoform X1 n=1 Tax=Papilio machaon TaxID=76193 RepID=UPI001E664943|nr:ribosomal RNA processing protein 36 homolog isoform X1 [Papilio machaon]